VKGAITSHTEDGKYSLDLEFTRVIEQPSS
jgi:hypothetical protein